LIDAVDTCGREYLPRRSEFKGISACYPPSCEPAGVGGVIIYCFL